MPFKAKIDGKTVISIDMSDEEWNELKKNTRSKIISKELLCCGNIPYLRTSKLGTKHFVHKTKNNCNWKPESPNHLRAKEIIFKACKEEGWNVEPEYIFNDWIADIFATNGNIKIAFEIQWSRQSAEETIRRQSKYENDDVKGLWFFRYIPESLNQNEKIPAFTLSTKEGNFFVCIDHFQKIELSSFIKNFLNDNIKFRNNITPKRVQIANLHKFGMECWRCKRVTPVIAVHSDYVSLCGHELHSMSISDEDLGMEILKLQKHGFKQLTDLAPIKKRYSKTVGNSYWSNGCKWCGAIVGEWFLEDALLENLYENSHPILELPFNLSKLKSKDYPHWCLSSDDGFCINYHADTSIIEYELSVQGYKVSKIDFTKHKNGFYFLSLMIVTKGNCNKEVLDTYKIMYKNGVADYYFIGIADYEKQSSWLFSVTKQTLDDFFSGRIAKDEYIKQVESKKLM